MVYLILEFREEKQTFAKVKGGNVNFFLRSADDSAPRRTLALSYLIDTCTCLSLDIDNPVSNQIISLWISSDWTYSIAGLHVLSVQTPFGYWITMG